MSKIGKKESEVNSMSYWIHQIGNSSRPNYKSFYMDSDSDLSKLPTSIAEGIMSNADFVAHKCCSIGSDAFSIASGKKYVLDSDNTWRSVSQQTGGSSSITGDFLSLSGGVLQGDLSMNGNHISNLADPVDAQDAASKSYVDSYLATDSTLSQSGKAADAKTVGEKFNYYLKSEEADLLYASKSELENYITSEDASDYASKEELSNMIGNPSEGYNSLESIGEIIDQLNTKVEAIRNSISSSIAVLTDGDSVQDAIADPGIITVAMVPGTFTGELTLNKTVNLIGYNSSVPANSGNRCSDVIDSSETIIDGTINISGENDVVLTGLTFTNNALISTSNQGTLTLKNCKILSMEADAAKSYLVKSTQSNPLKLIVENCYFGTNTANSVGNIYNGLELNCTLKDGSSISNNYFAAAACTHNAINIYAVEDDATIHIDNNHFEYSGNAIRIGIKGEPTCTIVCDGNSYDATDSTDEYAGLLLVQPYGKQTTSFANCTIKIDDTVHSDSKQLYYLYAGAGDMQFTNSNKPTIIIDGITEVQPTQT